MRHHILFVFFGLFLSLSASAQSLQGETQFSRQLEAIQWRQLSTFAASSSFFDLTVSNRLGSRFFLLNDRAQNIQNDRQTDVSLSGWMSPSVAVAADVRSFEFTSTRTRQDVALAGIEVRPVKPLFVRTQFGIMSDARNRAADQGFIYGIKAWTSELNPGEGLYLTPSLFMEVADIQPRRYVTTRYLADMAYRTKDVQMSASVQHGLSRREGYANSSFLNTADSEYIESVRIDTTSIRFQTRFPITRRWAGDIEVDALNQVRMVDNRNLPDDDAAPLYNSRTLRQAVDTRVRISADGDRLRSVFGMAVGVGIRNSRLTDTEGLPADQVRRRAELLTNSNFNQNRFELFTTQDLRITRNHDMSIFASSAILRYDTPETNPDDRDELTLLFRTVNRMRLAPGFEAAITTAGEAYHYVYLFSERSIENNWRRSIRLMPEFTWTPVAALTWRNVFLIRANYTVEDYELEGRAKNDQSARELMLFSDIDWRFLPEWSIRTHVSRSELRIGKLIWKGFREVPIETLITYDGTMELARKRGGTELAVGVRMYHKTDFLIRATQSIPLGNGSVSRTATGQLTTAQFGPLVRILFPFGREQE
ncbi:MAG: hypothetical protein RL177_816, partial [Bacteroidota bacterium]